MHVLCEHFSPVDESTCNSKPKSFRQVGRNPFNVGHNDLANYNVEHWERIARRGMKRSLPELFSRL